MRTPWWIPNALSFLTLLAVPVAAHAQSAGDSGATSGGGKAAQAAPATPPPATTQPAPGTYPQYPAGSYPGYGAPYPYSYPQYQYPQYQYPQAPPSATTPKAAAPGQAAPGQYAPQYPYGYSYPYPQGQYPPAQYPAAQYPQYPAPVAGQRAPQGYPAYPPGQYSYPTAPTYPPAGYGVYRDAYGRPYPAPGYPAPPAGLPPATATTIAPSAPATPVVPVAPAIPAAPAVIAAPPAVVAAPKPARLVLTTSVQAASSAALACVNALDHSHVHYARKTCAEAIEKDDALALAHLWLSQASATAAEAQSELTKASEHARTASRGEQLLVAGWRAWQEGRLADARADYDELALVLDGEPRVFTARGQFRQAALGDFEGAVTDYQKALALDEKFAIAHNLLGLAFAAEGKNEFAFTALKRYAELLPTEPNAHYSLALLALRRGEPADAATAARKALALDSKFILAHVALGDALLAQGKPHEARREYAALEASDDPALRHEGALRAAHALLDEDKYLDAEKALIKEADAERKAGSGLGAAETFLEAARAQIERGALAEAGRGIREALASMKAAETEAAAEKSAPPPSPVAEATLHRVHALLLEARAMSLAAVGERSLAEARADELYSELQSTDDARRTAIHAAGHAPVVTALATSATEDRVRELKGWIAQRSGDDKAAVVALEKATSPSMRLALAQALLRTGDAVRARSILEPLAHKNGADFESSMVHARAVGLLKTTASSTPVAASTSPTPATSTAAVGGSKSASGSKGSSVTPPASTSGAAASTSE